MGTGWSLDEDGVVTGWSLSRIKNGLFRVSAYDIEIGFKENDNMVGSSDKNV